MDQIGKQRALVKKILGDYADLANVSPEGVETQQRPPWPKGAGLQNNAR
jgi:hypothetical protein